MTDVPADSVGADGFLVGLGLPPAGGLVEFGLHVVLDLGQAVLADAAPSGADGRLDVAA
ncbi:hypothetical protein [Streptomyces bungoensis]|uniref:hypothetical protein n=1 Tax=Streptomyces bungoensis TaxID=285568 RepID=UPI001ABF4FD5